MLTREEWLEKAIGRYFERTDISHEQALDFAEITLDEMCEGDLTYDPVDSVDEDLSYWTE